MTPPRPERDDGVDERPLRPDGGQSLRRLLGSSSTDDLAALVERFWADRDYRTTRRERGGHLFVLARSSDDDDDRHLVWVDADASATPDRIETLVSLAAQVGADEATVISGKKYGPDVYTAVDEHGVECLAEEQLLTFVHRAGLESFVRRRHEGDQPTGGSSDTADSSPPNAVADGGATEVAREIALAPRADHSTTLRAALVGGGGVLALLSVWGGAAQVTSELQTCGGGCSTVWLLSFLPLAAMVLGSFAVAVGVFD